MSVIGGTTFLCLHKPNLLQRRCFSAEFSVKEETGARTKIEESGLVGLNSDRTGESEVAVYKKLQIPRMKPEIHEEIQSGFRISDLKVHFLEDRDEAMLSKRILKLSRSNKVRSALELYISMDVAGLRTSAHACNSLLACLLRNRSIDDALLVFEVMRKKGLPTGHTYSLILKAVSFRKDCELAIEMFSSFKEDEVSEKIFDVVVYNTMISICGKARNWVETERIWSRFKQINLSGTMITYSLLISAFVQCGQTELAVDAYHEMIAKGLEPDEDIMKAIVASCAKDGNWNFALNVFQKMLESGMKPSLIAYNSMINCLGRSGEDVLAFRIYELMKLSGLKPDVYTWSALLSSLYKSTRYADVLKLFESFSALSVSQSHCQLYNIALMSCQRLRLWERSLQILWMMEKRGMEMSIVSYNHVIRACEMARRPEVALQVYQHMIEKKLKPDTFTYLSLIRACMWGSLWTEVEKLTECISLDASLYNALVQGYCLRGKIILAKKMYTKMRSIGLNPDGKTRAMMLQHLSANRFNQRTRNQRLSLRLAQRWRS